MGTGYVGLVTGTCFAESGNDVTCIDIDEAKVSALQRGEIPIYEPGLTELVLRNSAAGRLSFTSDYASAVPSAQCVFIAVGTPQSDEGAANLAGLWAVAESLASRTATGSSVLDIQPKPTALQGFLVFGSSLVP
ncbi:MAG: 2-dehydropantoate 2-reductase N-terminal domain-containing protein [Planctomycetaceae bacterium]